MKKLLFILAIILILPSCNTIAPKKNGVKVPPPSNVNNNVLNNINQKINTNTNDNHQNVFTDPCENIAGAECATKLKLSDCMQASSITDYFSKKEMDFQIEGWPEDYTQEYQPPIKSKLSSVKILSVIQRLGGGDSSIIPLIQMGNTYCELNDENAKKLFAPITNATDALNYYLMLRRDLVGSLASALTYIMTTKDYNTYPVRDNSANCDDVEEAKIKNKVSDVQESPLQASEDPYYTLNLITFSYMIETGYSEMIYKVRRDGSIIYVSTKELLDCGPGAVF